MEFVRTILQGPYFRKQNQADMLIFAFTIQRSSYFWSHSGIHWFLLAHGHNWYAKHHLRSTLYPPSSSTSARKRLGESCIFSLYNNCCLWYGKLFFCLKNYTLHFGLWCDEEMTQFLPLSNVAFQIKHEGQWRISACLQLAWTLDKHNPFTCCIREILLFKCIFLCICLVTQTTAIWTKHCSPEVMLFYSLYALR